MNKTEVSNYSKENISVVEYWLGTYFELYGTEPDDEKVNEAMKCVGENTRPSWINKVFCH